jgi:hypothetical protein
MNPLRLRLDFVDNALHVSRIGDVHCVSVGGTTSLPDGVKRRL